MTTINKEVTREEERTTTVSTCDVCGLSEVEIVDGSIDRVTSGLSCEYMYTLQVQEVDDDGYVIDTVTEEVFESMSEASAALKAIDTDGCTVNKSTIADFTWELDIDACERCQQMMFGAMRDNFSMKSV